MKKIFFLLLAPLLFLTACGANHQAIVGSESSQNQVEENTPDKATVCAGMCQNIVQRLCHEEIAANQAVGTDMSESILDEAHCQLACEADWDDAVMTCVDAADQCAQFSDTAPYCLENGDLSGIPEDGNQGSSCEKACKNYALCAAYGDEITPQDIADATESCRQMCAVWTPEIINCVSSTAINEASDCAAQTACVLPNVRDLMNR